MLAGHHDNVGRVIEDWESKGWRLNTYACDGNASVTLGTNHYLLFEKGEESQKESPTIPRRDCLQKAHL